MVSTFGQFRRGLGNKRLAANILGSRWFGYDRTFCPPKLVLPFPPPKQEVIDLTVISHQPSEQGPPDRQKDIYNWTYGTESRSKGSRRPRLLLVVLLNYVAKISWIICVEYGIKKP